MLILLEKAVGFGMIGLLIECLFTGFYSVLIHRNIHGRCTTFLTMVPIYAFAGLVLEALRTGFVGCSQFFLIPLYVVVIYATELLFGLLYRVVTKVAPWDYGRSRWTVVGLINFKYLPFWFGLACAFNPLAAGLHHILHVINL